MRGLICWELSPIHTSLSLSTAKLWKEIQCKGTEIWNFYEMRLRRQPAKLFCRKFRAIYSSSIYARLVIRTSLRVLLAWL